VRRLLIGGVILAVLAWLAWQVAQRRAPAAVPHATAPDSVSAGVRAVRLYFASSDGDSLIAESRELVEATGFRERVAALVAELDRGPRGRGVAALPAGTSVLHVYVDERGLLTLDLSGAFRRGFRGGSTAEYLAVASLMRTLGTNLPEVKQVLIVCAGRPIATLGGHLPLDRPLDVSDWP
jgi:hypothetical protein